MSDWTEAHREAQDVLMRILDYIGNGGLFNPDLMDHDKVRDLVVDCRTALDAALAEIDRLTRRAECDGWRIEDLKVEIDRLTKVAVTPCACGENEGCSECRRVENPPHGPVSERFMRHHYGAKR